MVSAIFGVAFLIPLPRGKLDLCKEHLVQDVFDQSLFKHIQTTAKSRQVSPEWEGLFQFLGLLNQAKFVSRIPVVRINYVHQVVILNLKTLDCAVCVAWMQWPSKVEQGPAKDQRSWIEAEFKWAMIKLLILCCLKRQHKTANAHHVHHFACDYVIVTWFDDVWRIFLCPSSCFLVSNAKSMGFHGLVLFDDTRSIRLWMHMDAIESPVMLGALFWSQGPAGMYFSWFP